MVLILYAPGAKYRWSGSIKASATDAASALTGRATKKRRLSVYSSTNKKAGQEFIVPAQQTFRYPPQTEQQAEETVEFLVPADPQADR